MIPLDRATMRRPATEVGRTVSTKVAMVPESVATKGRRLVHLVAHPTDGDPDARWPLEFVDLPLGTGRHAATSMDEGPA